jgi:DNA-directed RNA polymerase subunit RPC12/RpoP
MADEIFCPYCGQENVSRLKRPSVIIAIVLSLMYLNWLTLLGLAIPVIKNRYFCYECQQEFLVQELD